MRTIGTVFAVIIFVVILIALGLFGRGCNTASRMADKTVFNADKHVWTYEEFHRQYNSYEQYSGQEKEVRAQMADLESKGIGSGNQRYDNLATEADGIRNMKRRIAAEYNKMSEIWYQDVWRSKGLPDRLN